MKKKTAAPIKNETPIFDIQAFGQKATWTDFYIQDLKHHIREHDFIEKPHKHDFYLILFILKGSGVHTIDFVAYPIEPNAIYLMTPGQVHTWSLSKETDGFIMFFTKAFYQMRLSDNNLLEFPFFHSLVASPFIRSVNDAVIKFTLQQMHIEYGSHAQPELKIIRAHLDLFLLKAAQYYDGSPSAVTPTNIFKLRKLEQLIDKHFRKLKQPSDYAELMNLAPGYLNSICKHALGKTLRDLIHERVLLEAKRLFAYSTFNVNEVAGKLNFDDASYFVRWFKKHTQQTPEEFRKLQQ